MSDYVIQLCKLGMKARTSHLTEPYLTSGLPANVAPMPTRFLTFFSIMNHAPVPGSCIYMSNIPTPVLLHLIACLNRADRCEYVATIGRSRPRDCVERREHSGIYALITICIRSLCSFTAPPATQYITLGRCNLTDYSRQCLLACITHRTKITYQRQGKP